MASCGINISGSAQHRQLRQHSGISEWGVKQRKRESSMASSLVAAASINNQRNRKRNSEKRWQKRSARRQLSAIKRGNRNTRRAALSMK